MRFLHNELHQYRASRFFSARSGTCHAFNVMQITLFTGYFHLTIVKIFKCEIAVLPLNSA